MPKKKNKEIISPIEKLRQTILKAQERDKPKPKKKVYTKKSLIKRATIRLKRIFSKKKKVKRTEFRTERTKLAERNLRRSISQKEIDKLRGKKK